MTRVILALCCCLGFIGAAPAATSAPALGLHLAPCAIGKSKTAARCGTFGVYENRRTGAGRIIPLRVIVVPAKHPQHRAIALIAGGPGESAASFAPFVLAGDFGSVFGALNDTYDLLFVDNRGMGQSNPFRCDLTPIANPAAYFRELFPNALVSACRKASSQTHDISQYNTNNAVDDLDDVRAALGYGKIVLSGGSYGTLFSMVYMRRHPDRIESVVLDGVAPPHFQPMPGEPIGAQHALDDLIAKCRGDAACSTHFPQFASHFREIVARLARGPIDVPVMNAATKQWQTVPLSKEVFVDQIRHVLYNPFGASYIPFIIERASSGDYRPLGRVIQTVLLGFSSDVNDGAYLSYSCADMMPFVSEADIRKAAAISFAGDLRIRAQQKACATWGVPAMPPSFNDAVRSDAPVLMILGSDDPATPAQYGMAALKYLPNGRAVLVKGGGHGADTDCTQKLELQFIRTASARGLDVNSCSATFKLPPFATSMNGFPQ